MKRHINKILAISTTGLGNLILYTPVLKILHQEFSSAYITLLVANPVCAALLEKSSFINEIIVIDKKRHQGLKFFQLLRQIRQKKFDLVITSFLDKSFKVALFSFLSGAKYRLGYLNRIYGLLYNYRTKIRDIKHEIEYNLDLLRSIGIEIRSREEKSPFIHLTPDGEKSADFFLGKNNIYEQDLLIGIHPGGGVDIGPTKRWPKEKFAVLGDMIIEKYKAKIILVGGKEERNICTEIARLMKYKPIIATGEVDIETTACLIKRCKVFVSNDSGLMHLAAAVKTKVVAIFGPTLFWKNYPWGEGNIVIRKDLPCSPCYSYKKIVCNNPQCLKRIKVEEVLEKIGCVLNSTTTILT